MTLRLVAPSVTTPSTEAESESDLKELSNDPSAVAPSITETGPPSPLLSRKGPPKKKTPSGASPAAGTVSRTVRAAAAKKALSKATNAAKTSRLQQDTNAPPME
jgi:hypothetical protein